MLSVFAPVEVFFVPLQLEASLGHANWVPVTMRGAVRRLGQTRGRCTYIPRDWWFVGMLNEWAAGHKSGGRAGRRKAR